MLKSFFKKVGSVVGARKIDEDLLDEMQEQLIMGDVSIETSEFLIEGLRLAAWQNRVVDADGALALLKNEVIELLGGHGQTLQLAPDGLTVWLMVGVNGVGKTTTAGKLAFRYAREGRKPLLAAADTFRAAAVEQLQEWGKRVDCPVIAQQAGADPAAVVFDAISSARARNRDLVIIDTAGRLHNKSNLMNELSKIARVVERETNRAPQETLLVVDASTGQNGLTQAQAFTQAAPLTGLILTKWDGTAKGGIILTIAHETHLPVKFIGAGEQKDDLQEFDPPDFAREIFA